MRDTSFSILKALAIILVVVAHAAAPTYVARFSYLINVPVFFVLAGYFFNLRNLNEKSSFVIRRFKRLYIPFLKWSIFFLLIHNLLFPIGLLSEQYGNSAGGVTHPYTWHQAMQNLWSIVFNMSGYDAFLAGAFWFFRALLLANFGFLLLFVLTSRTKALSSPTLQAAAIALLMLGLASWQSMENLRITGVAQGGYREIMGIFFMAIGFLLRRMESNPKASAFNHPLVGLFLGIIPLAALTIWYPVSMAPKAGSVASVFALALGGTAGFVFLRHLSSFLDMLENVGKRILVFIGDNSLYVFGFHLLAFKVVSALKVAVYGLPWPMVGGHPVVTLYKDDFFWLAYAVVGTALPLLWLRGWRTLCKRYRLKTATPVDWIRLLFKLSILLYRICLNTVIALYKFIIKVFMLLGQGFRDIVEASKPKEDED